MASLFSHGYVAFILGKTLFSNETSRKILFFGILCSILPDADVLAFQFGIPYAHPLGHRGFTHSIVFALLLSVFIKLVFFYSHSMFSKKGFAILLFLFFSTISHGILDAMTNGGLGIAFFSPFDNSRYFFPIRPIQVSPIGAKAFFSESGLRVILSELKFIVLPFFFFFLVFNLFKKIRKK